MDRVLHDIVDEGMKQEYFLNELDTLVRTSAASIRRPTCTCGGTATQYAGLAQPLAVSTAEVRDGATQTDDTNLIQVRNAMFDADVAVRNSQGLHIPLELRPHMTSFPRSMRIPSQRITINTILRIYLAKLKDDKCHDQMDLRRLTACQFLPVYYRSLYGQADIIDTQVLRYYYRTCRAQGVPRFPLHCCLFFPAFIARLPSLYVVCSPTVAISV